MNEDRDDLTQMNEDRDDLIEDIDIVMFIHSHDLRTGDISETHDHNSIAQKILEDLGIIPYGNWSDQVLALGGWTKLWAFRNPRIFEIESKTHEDLRHTLGRIKKHLRDANRVHLEVRDPNIDPPHAWKKSGNYSQLKEYISRGPGYI
jgi:hypothetical protein